MKRNYIICTGLRNPDLNHIFDESENSLPAINEHPFYGTLEQAKENGEELARIRWEGNYRRSPFAKISYWIKDEAGTLVYS